MSDQRDEPTEAPADAASDCPMCGGWGGWPDLRGQAWVRCRVCAVVHERSTELIRDLATMPVAGTA